MLHIAKALFLLKTWKIWLPEHNTVNSITLFLFFTELISLIILPTWISPSVIIYSLLILFLKEISPGISLEGMMLKLKLQYFGHLMRRVDSLEKTLMLGRDWGQEEKGTTEGEMAGWHHWLYGRESGWTPRVGDGQGDPACCDSWDRKESNTTERLIWSDLRELEVSETRKWNVRE